MENKELITKNKNTNPHLVEMRSSVENNAPSPKPASRRDATFNTGNLCWCEAVPRAGYPDRFNLSGKPH